MGPWGRCAVRTASAMIVVWPGSIAAAQVRTFDVPSQAAVKGVPELARQADVQILVSERLVRGRRTAAVRGQMSVREAIERSLRGTGLRAVSTDEHTFVLVTAPNGPQPRPLSRPKAPVVGEPAPAPANQEIVVTGFQSSLAAALEHKRRETAATDIIVAEDIGKFPDANLAESMQRLPGISLTRGDGGEGRNITVRGLAADFTRVRINGMEAASQTGSSDAYGGSNASRSFDFNVFPSELFASLAVRKTSSAKIEEGSLGATVDLDAPHPLDLRDDFVLTGTARGVYNGIAQRADPRVSALVAQTFAGGTFGLLASATYGRRHTRDVGYSAVLVLPAWVNGGFCSPVGVTPANPDPSRNAFKGTDALNCSTGNPRTGSIEAWNAIQARLGPLGQPGGGAFFPRLPRYLDSRQDAQRYGATASAQWSPDSDTSLTLDLVHAGYDVTRIDSYISGLSFARSASNNGQPMTSVRAVEINARGSVVYGLYDGVDVRSERWLDRFSTHLTQGTLRFEHRFGPAFKLSGLAGLGKSVLNSPTRMWLNIDANDTDGFAVDFRRNATFPTIDFGVDVADPNSFSFGPALADGTVRGTLGDRKLRRSTVNRSFGLDADWTVGTGLRIVAGGSWRVSDYRTATLMLDPARQATPALPAGVNLSDLTVRIDGLDRLLGNGAPASWVALDHDKWIAAFGYGDDWFCGVECGAGDARVREAIGAGYGMASFDSGRAWPVRVRGDVGLRYAHTDQSSFGYVPVTAPPGARYPTIGRRVDAHRTYGDWLPSITLVAELDPRLLVRLAAARVMSRPQLAALIPGGTIDAVGRRGTITNPMLDPVRATTWDAAIEWYPAPASLVSVAYFRKDIGTFVQSINSLIPFNRLGLPNELLVNSQTQPDELFTINQLANTPGGRLEGVELNVQAPLAFLPGVLGRTGILASLTLVTSRINYILQSEGGSPTLTSTDDLVGLSRRAVSGTFYYEGSRFGTRVTGNYRSGFIRTIPSGAFDSDLIGNHPTFFVDFYASYRLGRRVKLLFEAQNLTDEANVQYIDSVRQDSLFALRNGRTFTLGVSFRL